MAQRTLTEIYNQIAAEKDSMSELDNWYTDQADPGSTLDNAQTLLSDLSSTSKVAVWRLFMWIVAVAIWIHEGLWYVFKGEVETMLEKHIAHTPRWYREESLKFQYGDELVWDEDLLSYVYTTYDESKRIVARAACTEGAGVVAIKAARLVNDVPEALSAPQKAAFESFWAKYKDAGVILNIISEDADMLRVEYQIFYDPLVLDEFGAKITDASKPVETAINDYLNALDFNGRLRLESLDAAVRNAEGVVDFVRLTVQSKYGTNSYADITISEVAYSGYYKIDTDNYPLEDTITYTANV